MVLFPYVPNRKPRKFGQSPYVPDSNYITIDQEVVSFTADGCTVRLFVKSASYFCVVPGNDSPRRCALISLELKLAEASSAPTVMGYDFKSLEKDTLFLEEFAEDLRDPEGSHLGANWELHGYHDLFLCEQKIMNRWECIEGSLDGGSTFTFRGGRGFMGAPMGLVATVPLTLLLDFQDAVPPTVPMTVNATIQTEKVRKSTLSSRFGLGRHGTQSSSWTTPAFELPGPRLPVVVGEDLHRLSADQALSRVRQLGSPTCSNSQDTYTAAERTPANDPEQPPAIHHAEDEDEVQTVGGAEQERQKVAVATAAADPDAHEAEPAIPAPVAQRYTDPNLAAPSVGMFQPGPRYPLSPTPSSIAAPDRLRYDRRAAAARLDGRHKPSSFIKEYIDSLSRKQAHNLLWSPDADRQIVRGLIDRYGRGLPVRCGCQWLDFELYARLWGEQTRLAEAQPFAYFSRHTALGRQTAIAPTGRRDSALEGSQTMNQEGPLYGLFFANENNEVKDIGHRELVLANHFLDCLLDLLEREKETHMELLNTLMESPRHIALHRLRGFLADNYLELNRNMVSGRYRYDWNTTGMLRALERLWQDQSGDQRDTGSNDEEAHREEANEGGAAEMNAHRPSHGRQGVEPEGAADRRSPVLPARTADAGQHPRALPRGTAIEEPESSSGQAPVGAGREGQAAAKDPRKGVRIRSSQDGRKKTRTPEASAYQLPQAAASKSATVEDDEDVRRRQRPEGLL